MRTSGMDQMTKSRCSLVLNFVHVTTFSVSATFVSANRQKRLYSIQMERLCICLCVFVSLSAVPDKF